MSKATQDLKEKAMKRALELAMKPTRGLLPNPRVGAVFTKEGKVLGEGYYCEFGGSHAEVLAIKDAQEKGNSLDGADLFVTLEPCCFFGKTPACTDALKNLVLKNIYVASLDPDQRVAGKGVELLKEYGFKVEVGVCNESANLINQPFLKNLKHNSPYVTLKSAVSLDGKTACVDGSSQWITGKKSRDLGYRLRAQHDAICVGIGTVLADNPNLGVHGFEGDDPKRIILDSKLRISFEAQVLRDKNVLLVTTDQADMQKKRELLAKGFELLVYQGAIDLQQLMADLYQRKIFTLMVEGGSQVNGSFWDEGLVDRYLTFIAPKVIGGNNAPGAIGGLGVATMKNVITFKQGGYKLVGEDLMYDGYVNFY